MSLKWFTFQHAGRTYNGAYELDGTFSERYLRVMTPFGEKSSPWPTNNSPESLARSLVEEMALATKRADLEPHLGAESFHCPHCGLLGHQTWFWLFAEAYGDRGYISRPVTVDPSLLRLLRKLPKERAAYFDRKARKRPFFHIAEEMRSLDHCVENCSLSVCSSCSEFATTRSRLWSSVWLGRLAAWSERPRCATMCHLGMSRGPA
jgi:hypothetical protein